MLNTLMLVYQGGAERSQGAQTVSSLPQLMDFNLIITREMRRKGSRFLSSQLRARKSWGIAWGHSAALVFLISRSYQALAHLQQLVACCSHSSKSSTSCTGAPRHPLISLSASVSVSLRGTNSLYFLPQRHLLFSVGSSASAPPAILKALKSALPGSEVWAAGLHVYGSFLGPATAQATAPILWLSGDQGPSSDLFKCPLF